MNLARRLFSGARLHYARSGAARLHPIVVLRGGLAFAGTAALLSMMQAKPLLGSPTVAFTAPAQPQQLQAREIEPSKELAGSLHKYLLIDVVDPQERVNANLIPTSVNIPLRMILDNSVSIPTNQPIIMVCPAGARSMLAANSLLARGFTEVYNLKGGSSAWVKAGLPTEKLHVKEVPSSKDLEHKLDNYIVIDVREPHERVETGFVPNSINLPLQTVLDGSAPIPLGKPLLMVCHSGRRSMRAAENLVHRGYDVTNLAGGTMGWIHGGHRVQRNSGL